MSFETETNSDLPAEISYSNEDLDRDMVRPKLRANTVYRGKVAFANKVVNKSGSLAIETVWNPLDPDGKPRSPSARHKLTLPFANPNKPGGKVPDTMGFCHDYLNALYPTKFPKYPRRQKDGTYLTADGQTVNKETAVSLERQIKKSVRDQIQSYWANPADLIGEVAYILIEDTEWRGVDKVMTECPDGLEPRLSDFADTNY